MKKQMKNNKGITLTSLVIYIALMFVVLAILIRIMTYYTGNLSDMADVTWDAQIEKINIYFLDEAQKVGNEVKGCSDNEISFSSGNTYTFIEEERTLYLNDSIKICENLYYCEFATETAANGKTVVIVNVTRVEGELAKEIRYVSETLYQEVEYIESTGEQYIDTGVNGGEKMAFKMKANTLGFMAVPYEQYFAGDVTPKGIKLYAEGSDYMVISQSSLGFDEFNQGADGNIDLYPLQDANDHIIEFTSEGTILVDGEIKDENTPNNGWGELTYYVFNSHSEPDSAASMRLYELKMWSNDKLIRDFVPCYRKADGAVGLYDNVYGMFYENIGTGEFNKGPDVVRESIVVGNNNYINEEEYITQMEEDKLHIAYKEVEYIESTGEQYIDTGVNGGETMSFEMKINTLGTTAVAYEQYFAGDVKPKGIKLYARSAQAIVVAQSSLGEKSDVEIHSLYDDNSHTVEFTSEGNIYVDGILKAENIPNNGWGELTYYVFNSHSEPDSAASMRLYELKMWSNDKLVRDFVPCYRVSDNVAGLYDKVEGKFYENAGEGDFKTDKDLERLYKQVEYIESTGTQYIDTDIVMSKDVEIQLGFQYSATTNANGIYDTGLFGVGISNVQSNFCTFMIQKNNVYVSLGNRYGNIITPDTKYHTLIFNSFEGKNIILDDVKYLTLQSTNFMNERNLWLFRVNQSNLVTGAQAKIYYCKLYEGENLVRDFIPCYRKSDNVAGLYDKVEGKFYENAGTGSFVIPE